MTIHRLTRSARAPFRTAAAILLLLPVAASPAFAAHRHAPRIGDVPTRYDSFDLADPSRPGSNRSIGDFGLPGRSLRSSTLGNAEFPERDPIAQNLGMTSGGGSN
ncbi:hypothetical protein [Methylobacterium haplocladii]|uniref:Uncharacterized protein n=1 Tax=Methylobacterium haplocladii TaxID=1176176 RepID=A0A512IRQ6_9HYPH|nr:hypothetical protein [Methylobacterium haplocladii]GEP00387.1 hypothetical protein MHA02_27740 [Methylobacterium haplocladii]GJD82592.1 hypothetical protein HPGCJGGD_0450 [Methylobacterium haplocladii]GLS58829.1 hypothetical protein GCM10007887_14950 [Methylobacterium haplocladii]